MVKNIVSRLTIGTANFGLDYGINNPAGKLSDTHIEEILDLANKNGINFIDTAQAYGDAERRISNALKKVNAEFNIITKLKPSLTHRVIGLVDNSVVNLNTEGLYGVLYHNFEDFIKNKTSFEQLEFAREKGLVKKIGFSVYYPSEIEFLLKKNIQFDIVQLPYNIFDRRFEYLFPELKIRGVEIFARSIFLQGLFFIKPERLPKKLTGANEKLKRLNEITESFNISISSLCLNYVIRNEFIDKLVIGIDSKEQLLTNIQEIQKDNYSDKIQKELNKLKITDEQIILPFNWE